MEKLVKLFSYFVAVLKTQKYTAIEFNQDILYTSAIWNKPGAQKNITDVTFINMSTAGTIYIENIPLEPGQTKSYTCQWNEINLTQYDIRIDTTTVTNPTVIVDYKTKAVQS